MRSFIFSLALVTAVSGTMISANAAHAGDQSSASDENAAQSIAKNLKQSGKLKDYRVGVKYEDGVAWLMGTVTSPQQKQIAEQLARQSEGVQHVVSKLEVERPEGALGSDEQLEFASNEMPAERQLAQRAPQRARSQQGNMPVPYARTASGPQGRGIQAANFSQAQYCPDGGCQPGGGGQMGPGGMSPAAMGPRPPMAGGAAVSYDNPQMPGYAWPSYAASPNYAALTYPKQYSASAWPYIGPFYPYPQVPLGWRKVTLEWDDGWWNLDFSDSKGH